MRRATESENVPADPAPPGAPPTAAPPTHDGATTADAAGEDLHCPLCDYNLRGISEPRCPECGYRFEWDALRDPARRLHPYLFEHHPERNVGSFLRTLLGGLRPRRFWQSLHPAQEGRPGRLVAYWLVLAAPMVLAAAAWNVAHVAKHRADNELMRSRVRASIAARPNTRESQQLIRQFGSVEGYLDYGFPRAPRARFYYHPWWDGPGALNGVAFVVLAWPWLTFLTLLLFRFSMRRARIRPVHVLRCVVYGFDAVLWAGLAAAAVAGWVLWAQQGLTRGPPGGTSDWLWGLLDAYTRDPVAGTALAAAALLLPFMAWRLIVAYRQYLRFDHAAATVLASQLIVLLAFLVLAVNASLGF